MYDWRAVLGRVVDVRCHAGRGQILWCLRQGGAERRRSGAHERVRFARLLVHGVVGQVVVVVVVVVMHPAPPQGLVRAIPLVRLVVRGHPARTRAAALEQAAELLEPWEADGQRVRAQAPLPDRVLASRSSLRGRGLAMA